MTFSLSTRMNLPQWSSGTDVVNRTQFQNGFAAVENLAAMYLQGSRSARPAAGVSGRFYKCTNTSGAGAGTIYYDDGTSWTSIVSAAEDATVKSSAAGVVPLKVQGAAGQTSHLQQWQDPSGTNVVAINADGRVLSEDTTGAANRTNKPVCIASFTGNSPTNLAASTYDVVSGAWELTYGENLLSSNGLVAPVNGLYYVYGQLGFGANNTGSIRIARLSKNFTAGGGGSVMVQNQTTPWSGFSGCVLNVSCFVPLTTADSVKLTGWHNASSGLTPTSVSEMGMVYVGHQYV